MALNWRSCQDLDYISVVVAGYRRPDLLMKLLDSFEKRADIPYEVVVHEDGAGFLPPEQREAVMERCSTYIANLGERNLGLSSSINRAVACSHGAHVVMLNDDCALSGPVLKDLCALLSNPFIGAVLPLSAGPAPAHGLRTGGYLSRTFGSGSVIAFRRDAWDMVGGFPEELSTNTADWSFCTSLLMHGFFFGAMEKEGFANNDPPPRTRQTHPTFSGGYDSCYPRIFKADPKDLLEHGAKRRENQEYYQRSIRFGPFSKVSTDWGTYLESFIRQDGSVDWEKAQPQHRRWEKKVGEALR